MGKGGVHCGSAYLFSGVGIAAACNLDLLDTIAFTLAGLIGPWMLGGDWNCSPAELEATGWLKKIGGTIHAPQAATCNGKVYDFFVVANAISHNVQGTYAVGDAGLTPHSPARLLFRGGSRKVMVRQLKTQVSLPAILPHGPLQMQHVPFDPLVELYRSTDQNFADLSKHTHSPCSKASPEKSTKMGRRASGRKDPSSSGKT